MYSVLLVDDEQWIIKGLICGINWEKYELTVAGQARNGIEALRFIEEHKPAIVITDIQMPGMNGLELIKNAKSICPDTLFILLSGYAEFSYAQKALMYGVYNYCLKPFELEDIEATLSRAVKELKKRESSTSEDLPYISDTLSSNDSNAINAILSTKNLVLSDDNPLITLISLGSDKLSLDPSISYISFKTGYQRYAYLFPESDLKKMMRYIEFFVSNWVSIGIGHAITDCLMIDQSLDAATTAAYTIFITGERGIYTAPILNTNSSINEILSKLLIAMNSMEYSQICMCLDQAYNEIVSKHLSIQYAYMLYHVINYMFQSNAMNKKNAYIGDYEKLFLRFGTLENMIECLKTYAADICSQSGATLPVEHTTLKKILKYIDEHMTEDLTVHDITNKFYISGSYLSQLFKKEVGTNFVDYITRNRVSYACNLLINTDKQVQEISQECGYNDYCYFAKIFKRYQKVTPSEYRASKSIPSSTALSKEPPNEKV